jgi:hypothetical protein
VCADKDLMIILKTTPDGNNEIQCILLLNAIHYLN